MERIIGIDLGTTNSLSATVFEDGPEIIGEGENRVTPSILSWNNGRWLVAQEAQKKRISDPENTVFSIKRLMGRGLEDLEKMVKELPYKIIETDALTANLDELFENNNVVIPLASLTNAADSSQNREVVFKNTN